MSKLLNAAPYTAAAVVALGAIGGAYFSYQRYKENQKIKLQDIALSEKEWRYVGDLQELYVYPIKSCGPVVNQYEAECTTLGLKQGWLRDRCLMVIDEKNNFITARAYPELLLVQPCVIGSVLSLLHGDMPDLHVNLAQVVELQSKKIARVWGCTVPVLDCGDASSEWFSRLLEKHNGKFRLVYYASEEPRPFRDGKKGDSLYARWLQNDTGAFPDEVPFNIINQSSVDELNSRLKNITVTARNFRPNFVVCNADPYDEDQWKFIKIRDNVFEVIKPCTRCVLTTIDPETGVKSSNSEPLATLQTYRQVEDPAERRAAGNSPRMGLQIALRSTGGRLVVGDAIYVA